MTEDINPEFIEECQKSFNENPSNEIAKNAIISIGSMISTVDSKNLNSLNHIFLNSIKKHTVKATNQGRSGRCWMFSGLNIFRHNVIDALEMDNFEFSETYLFFWDKLERSNCYLKWFIQNPHTPTNSEAFKFMVDEFNSDGGWWNMFTAIVKKYGVVPKNTMKETWNSEDSEDMNKILKDILQSSTNYILNKNLKDSEIEQIRKNTLIQIYSTLVKFLGEPPTHFRWAYNNTHNISNIITDLTPHRFKDMTMADIDLDDFVVLTHLPGKLKERKLYEIRNTKNVYESKNFSFINLTIGELAKYTQKSILAGLPVWFAADISQDFNPYHSTLDDQFSITDKIFGKKYKFEKKDKIF